MVWLKGVRITNLLVVVFTLLVLQLVFGCNQHLILRIVLGGSIICIAAAGYLINDFYDYPIDRINKPDKVWIHKYVPPYQVLWVYGGLQFIAFGLLLYIGDVWLLLINVGCMCLLWWYAKKLKCTPLWGNLLVAFLCAWVVVEALWWDWIDILTNPLALALAGGYIFFAFFSTLAREIIKDAEDLEGDKACNCSTIAVCFGKNVSLKWANSLALVLGLGILIGMAFGGIYDQPAFLWIGLLLLPPLIAISYGQYQQLEFSQLSMWWKLYMLVGLIGLLVYKYLI